MFKKWFLLTNQSYTWYHITTHGIIHTRWWFHKWSSTLSDHQMKNASLTYKSSSLANGWPMQWLRGRCPTKLVSRSKILCVVSQELYKWCHSNIFGSVHKNARFKPQPSTLMQAFASMRSTPFMEIDDKGGEIVQRYESFGRDWDKEVEFGRD